MQDGKDSASDTFPLVFTFQPLLGSPSPVPPRVGDDDADDEKITLTATSGAITTGENSPTITITDHHASLPRNARSIRGMRVQITTPAAGAYAPTGKDKIKVQVLRKGLLAAEYGAFSSVKVSLFNDPPDPAVGDATPAVELYSLAITDAVQLGTLAVPRVRTATLTGAIACGVRRQTLRRSLMKPTPKRIIQGDPVQPAMISLSSGFIWTAGGGPYEYVYAVATFGSPEILTEYCRFDECFQSKAGIRKHRFSLRILHNFQIRSVMGGLLRLTPQCLQTTLVSAITVTIIGDPDPDDPNDDGVEAAS